MKLVVPLTMPSTRLIRSPASDSRSGPQQRDGTGHGRLVEQVDAGLPGRRVQLRPGRCDQGLVGGDHRGAALEGAEDQLSRGVEAAEQLDDEVRAGVEQRLEVVGEQLGPDARTLAGRLAHPDPRDDQPSADPRCQVVGLLLEQTDHLRAHGSAAEHDDGQLLGGGR